SVCGVHRQFALETRHERAARKPGQSGCRTKGDEVHRHTVSKIRGKPVDGAGIESATGTHIEMAIAAVVRPEWRAGEIIKSAGRCVIVQALRMRPDGCQNDEA